MKLLRDKFAVIIEDFNYTDEECEEVRNLIGSNRTVVIRNENPVEPSTLVNFYKRIGNVVTQNEKVKGAVGEHRELIKVRQNGLFAGADDGELEWHSAGMNRYDHDDVVAMYMHEMAETGGDTYFSDHQVRLIH